MFYHMSQIKTHHVPNRFQDPQKFLAEIETPMAEPKSELKKDSLSGHHSEKSPKHDKETHGTSDDIDENTPIDVVKGPSVFERVKEEVEAVVEAIIHPHRDSGSHDSSPKS